MVEFDAKSFIHRMCRSKVAYSSRKMAAQTRRKMGKDNELKAYECPFCNSWHLGHTPNDRRQMRREISYALDYLKSQNTAFYE